VCSGTQHEYGTLRTASGRREGELKPLPARVLCATAVVLIGAGAWWLRCKLFWRFLAAGQIDWALASSIAGVWLSAATAGGVVWAGRWGAGLRRKDRIALLVFGAVALIMTVVLMVMRWRS